MLYPPPSPGALSMRASGVYESTPRRGRFVKRSADIDPHAEGRKKVGVSGRFLVFVSVPVLDLSSRRGLTSGRPEGVVNSP